MVNNVLGSPNSKAVPALQNGRRIAVSPADAASLSYTLIPTVPRNMVALIDDLYIRFTGTVAANTTYTLTLTANSQNLKFVARTDALANTTHNYDIHPKGSLMVLAGSTLAVTASAANQWMLQCEYRLVSQWEAMTGGYMPGIPFMASLVDPGTAVATDVITAATVTKLRGIDLRGLTITGYQNNAAAGASKEIMLEFYDGTTSRKIIKNCYGTTALNNQKPLIISQCRIRGPRNAAPFTANSYGIRATFGGIVAGDAAVNVWGFYYTDTQHTSSGTGVPAASATAASDLGDQFWFYSEAVATGITEWYPSTTLGSGQRPIVIEGYSISMAGNTGDATTAALSKSDGTSISLGVIFSGSLGTVAGAITSVYEGQNILVSTGDRPSFGIVNILGTIDKCGMTVWGRVGGPGRSFADTIRTGA